MQNNWETSPRRANFSVFHSTLLSNSGGDWILDDGGIVYYFANLDLLENTTEITGLVKIYSASQTLYATNKGTANVKLPVPQCLSIECWYVPNFQESLVSRYKLVRFGFKTVFNTKLDS